MIRRFRRWVWMHQHPRSTPCRWCGDVDSRKLQRKEDRTYRCGFCKGIGREIDSLPPKPHGMHNFQGHYTACTAVLYRKRLIRKGTIPYLCSQRREAPCHD